MKLKVDPITALYVSIGAATFPHSTWSAATILQGPMPADPGQSFLWHANGVLVAIAMDIGMIVASRSLSMKWSWFMLFAFVVSALGSFFCQIFYAASHTAVLNLSTGVSDYWRAILQSLFDARIVIVPMMLPLLGIFYAVAKSGKYKAKLQEEESIKKGSYSQFVQVSKDTPLLEDGQPADKYLAILQSAPPELVNLEELKFYDNVIGRWRGPYRTPKSLYVAMKTLDTRRNRKGEIKQ